MNRHVNTGLVVLAAVMLTACSAQPRLPDATTVQINDILNQSPGEGMVWATENCLSTTLYGSVEVLDETRLLFRGRGGKMWVNELRTPCRSLRRDDTLMFELHSSSACAMDRVSVVDHVLGWSRAGPTCTLGKFRAIPADQAAMITDLLRAR